MYYEKHRACAAYAPRFGDKQQHLLRITAACLALLVLLLALAAHLHSLMRPAVETHSTNMFTRAVNEAVAQVMADGCPERLVALSTDGDGAVTAVETDAAQVNLIRAAVCDAVMERLADSDMLTRIPVGSLTGLDILSGRGAEIELRLRPASGVTAELLCSLEPAGINQTRHSITCRVSADMYAMLPTMRVPVQLDTSVLLAESVIVGEVPEAYTYVVGDSADTIGRIFDYGYPNGR